MRAVLEAERAKVRAKAAAEEEVIRCAAAHIILTMLYVICLVQVGKLKPFEHCPMACRQQEAFERELERYNIRRAPLGLDRNYRRYWWGAGQRSHIYVENEMGRLAVISTVQEVDDLMSALDKRGVRELGLFTALEKVSKSFWTFLFGLFWPQ